ncbi:trimeric intracellular cation channel family protein [Acidisphaera sp. S103]|uniref:trimeric intracellular cation channel family protein n=1 Tax=Acidisphaera sp. S103 TaxID=1747223 RepID=UPI0020B15E27|nr:trimeric intracellular cation channel family protein [Acidisphaera sp. S103]
MRRRIGLANLVLAADLGGTFVFALEGASIACQAGLDLLGVVVIGFVAALGGGIIRDVLLGAVPPAAIRDQRYPLATIAGAVVAVLAALALPPVPAMPLIVLDAAGLALFAVAGTQKALVRGIGPFGTVLMGTLTAVGGGVVRDVLLTQVPVILRTDFYATAAILGCVAILLVRRCGFSMQVASATGGLMCFAARLLGVFWHWHLPVFH